MDCVQFSQGLDALVSSLQDHAAHCCSHLKELGRSAMGLVNCSMSLGCFF